MLLDEVAPAPCLLSSGAAKADSRERKARNSSQLQTRGSSTRAYGRLVRMNRAMHFMV